MYGGVMIARVLEGKLGHTDWKQKEVVLDTMSCDFAGLHLCGYKGKLHMIIEEKIIKS